MESIDSWRGKIVDYTISEFIVPKLNKKQPLNGAEIFDFAKKLTRARYEFAKAEKHKTNGLKKTELKYEYAALYDFEFKNSTENIKNKLKLAWSEIITALSNFLDSTNMLEYLKTSNYLARQKNLSFNFHGFSITGVPDLIAFFPNKPPHILDWKVHYYGTKTYNEQLLVYAIALKNCKPHRDFPADLSKYSVQDIRLTECQLLKNTVRNYSISDENIEMIYDFIADGLQVMKRKKCHKKYEELQIDDFEKTHNLDNCKTCPFKNICSEDYL